MTATIQFSTNTATLAIFDPEALAHRINDDIDWWSDPYEELDEVNLGNLMLIGLRSDGIYTLNIERCEQSQPSKLQALITCKSGKLFFGPGEEIPGGDFAPFKRPLTVGELFDFPVGTYSVNLEFRENEINVFVCEVMGDAINKFERQLFCDDI
ncbi:integrin [Elysia marginata]|uniref:Integrin n=1 Tax=Elysia marginata TaxID=1093978 RepID=A0AAV4EYN9_9GAST|nr:integrin [Elysia marginata]